MTMAAFPGRTPLPDRFASCKAVIGVIGLGYVGLTIVFRGLGRERVEKRGLARERPREERSE